MNREAQSGRVKEAIIELASFLRSPEAKDPVEGIRKFQRSRGANLLRGIYRTEGRMINDILNRMFPIYSKAAVFDIDDLQSSFYKGAAQNRLKNYLSETSSTRQIDPGSAASSPSEKQGMFVNNFTNITKNPSDVLPQSTRGPTFFKPSPHPDTIPPKARYGPDDAITRPLGGLALFDLFKSRKKPDDLEVPAFHRTTGKKLPVIAIPGPEGYPVGVTGTGETEVQRTMREQKNRKIESAQKFFGSEGPMAQMTGGKNFEDNVQGLGKAIGMVVPGLGKFIEVTAGAVGSLRKWGDNLHASNMQFAKYSHGMAAVQARQEVRDIFLERSRGENRAESAEFLAKGKHEFAKGTAPITDAIAKGWNYLAGGMLGGLGKLFGAVTGGASQTDKAADDLTALLSQKLAKGELNKEQYEKGLEQVERWRRQRAEEDEAPFVVGRWLDQAGWPERYGRPDMFDAQGPPI